jgi:hypothetical protein
MLCDMAGMCRYIHVYTNKCIHVYTHIEYICIAHLGVAPYGWNVHIQNIHTYVYTAYMCTHVYTRIHVQYTCMHTVGCMHYSLRCGAIWLECVYTRYTRIHVYTCVHTHTCTIHMYAHNRMYAFTHLGVAPYGWNVRTPGVSMMISPPGNLYICVQEKQNIWFHDKFLCMRGSMSVYIYMRV